MKHIFLPFMQSEITYELNPCHIHWSEEIQPAQFLHDPLSFFLIDAAILSDKGWGV